MPAENVTDTTILLIAAFVGEVRLIDNLLMDDKT
jgi:pantothenate synthetase